MRAMLAGNPWLIGLLSVLLATATACGEGADPAAEAPAVQAANDAAQAPPVAVERSQAPLTTSTGSNPHELYAAKGFQCRACHPCGVRQPGGHAISWMDTASTGFHAFSANANLASCATCHGSKLDGVGGSTTVSCAQCHGATWKTSCVLCHGGTDNSSGAPPKTVWGSAGDSVRVGAHTAHVGATHALSGPIACSRCHPVPADALSPGHANGTTADVSFSGISVPASGSTPAWNRAQATCSSTYCHGATLSGGTRTTPVWTALDGSQRSCSSCHGAPPPAPHTQSTGCGSCHAGYTSTTVNAATHVNGVLDVTGSNHPAGWSDKAQHGYAANTTGLAGCKSCHGADLAGGTSGVSCSTCHAASGFAAWATQCTFCHGNRATGVQSPPVDIRGQSVATNTSVGRHATHVAPAYAAPIACAECHPARGASVVTDTAHVDGNGLAELQFGTLARTGSVTPSYTRTSATAATCASTYCHGNFSGGRTGNVPSWTSTATSSCTSCHGSPPSSPGRHGTHQSKNIACSTCHGAGYARTGTTTGTVAKATHVNGVKNLTTTIGWNAATRTCANSCHGSKRW